MKTITTKLLSAFHAVVLRVRRSFAPMNFINDLDGELCDYEMLNALDDGKRTAQDMLQACVKSHYGFDIYPKIPNT